MTGARQEQARRTRAAILGAARARFTTEGYQRATIRAIAADAGIDASMVMRYYGSKDALFAAAADVDLALPDLASVPREQLGATTVRHFLARWEGSGTATGTGTGTGTDDGLRVLLASATTSAAAADWVQDVLRAQLQPVVAAAGPHAPGQAATRAGLVATQVLGLALCRYVLRLPPVAGLDADAVVEWIAPTIQRYLTAPRP